MNSEFENRIQSSKYLIRTERNLWPSHLKSGFGKILLVTLVEEKQYPDSLIAIEKGLLVEQRDKQNRYCHL